MRQDENGNQCPATLGEYRDLVAAIAGTTNQAVRLLDQKIAEQGRDADVVAADSQMRELLFPLMVKD